MKYENICQLHGLCARTQGKRRGHKRKARRGEKFNESIYLPTDLMDELISSHKSYSPTFLVLNLKTARDSIHNNNNANITYMAFCTIINDVYLHLPSAPLTLKAKTPLTLFTRLLPSVFNASSIPSNITVDLNPLGCCFALLWKNNINIALYRGLTCTQKY